jgi:purine nucleosidase
MRHLPFHLLLGVAVTVGVCRAGDDYAQHRAEMRQRDSRNRVVPVVPPAYERLRVIIDSDTGNEIDDIWAIALALRCPQRFQIEGFIAANYDNDSPSAGPNSIETSAHLIGEILDRAGMRGKIPIKRGSPPMQYSYEPSESEGVDFIIKTAMASPPDDPLWVIGLGASTDIASAYLKEPRIAEHVVVFWHFRTEWPKRCWNFNVIGDVRAARGVFHSDLSFVLFDTGTNLTCPMEQSARWADFNPLAKYVHEFRHRNKAFESPTKGFFDLGDIAALVDPSLAQWVVVDCPEVNWDLAYQFKGTKGKILRCGKIDRDKTFALFESKLKG